MPGKGEGGETIEGGKRDGESMPPYLPRTETERTRPNTPARRPGERKAPRPGEKKGDPWPVARRPSRGSGDRDRPGGRSGGVYRRNHGTNDRRPPFRNRRPRRKTRSAPRTSPYPPISFRSPSAQRLAVAHGAAFAIGYRGSWVTARKMAHSAF